MDVVEPFRSPAHWTGARSNSILNRHQVVHGFGPDPLGTMGPSRETELRPPPGSVKLISTKLTNTNLVSLEQFQHKPMGMYGGVMALFQ